MRLGGRVAILGGADPGNPLDPDHSVRHAAVGGLLICVAAWAWAAAAGMLHSSLRAPWPVAICGGLLIAAVIFCIDVLITCTPLPGDKLRYRARIILVRGMISLAMGLAIAHATILVMYRAALDQIVAGRDQIVAETDASRIKAHSQWPRAIASAQLQITGYQVELRVSNRSYGRAQGELDRSRAAWLRDRLCINGSGRAANGDWCGNGNVADPLRRAYETLNRSFPALQRAHSQTVASLDAAIAGLDHTIVADRNRLAAEIHEGIRADLANTGLAAQSEALWTLLRRDVFLWLWPAFFVVIDLAVALMKGILPESEFDRRRRRDRQRDDRIHQMADEALVWHRVADHVAGQLAAVTMARADAAAEREMAALRSAQQPQPPVLQRAWSHRKKLAWTASASASVAITLVLTFTTSLGAGSGQPVNLKVTASGGQSIDLRDGERLTIPVGAISGDAPVTATYTAAQTWPGNTPASDEVTFSTTGKITGSPVLSLRVPRSERPLALTGALHLAFRSPDTGEWTPYPAVFNAETNTMVALLTHFSTWRFWRWNWAGDLTHIGAALGHWAARRASSAPHCSSGPRLPAWYRTSSGIANRPTLSVRSCIEGHAGRVLDVQLVNNRPYGLILTYGHAALKWGWHAPPHTLADVLRDAVGDRAARLVDGLYLPPLSRASVGIENLGAHQQQRFAIAPATGTILGDALGLSLGSLISQPTPATTTAVKWARHIATTAMPGSCAESAAGRNSAAIPAEPVLRKLLTGPVPGCLEHLLTRAARDQLAGRDGMPYRTITRLSAAVRRLETIISARRWAEIGNGLAGVLDFRASTGGKLGFGFTVLGGRPHRQRQASLS